MIFVVENVPFVINWKRERHISHEAFGTPMSTPKGEQFYDEKQKKRTVSQKMADHT